VPTTTQSTYTAQNIQVLKGLDPVEIVEKEAVEVDSLSMKQII
jgi:hypothetical protein